MHGLSLSRVNQAKVVAMLCFAGLLLAIVGSERTAAKRAPAGCPNPPPVVINSPEAPVDVCIPDNFPANANPIKFFDDYSWRIFIAMVWPARQGQRGVPDTGQTISAPGPRVFETYKSAWEVFHRDGSTPAAWDIYEGAPFNACNQSVQFGDIVLASFSKFGDIGQADFGTLVGPLVTQNMTYARYLTTLNRVEFDQISSNNWFLRANLGTSANPLTFNNGAIDVKSAWIDMTGIAHPERYYKSAAWILDPATGQCTQKQVGLVGIHIVQKTPSRPQWIWSSFEQIDNIPQTGAQAPFAFNDGSGTSMPNNNPIHFPPPDVPPLKFNVQRLTPINPSTLNTNREYRAALAQQNSVWQFYQLVTTQWPLQLNPPQPIPPTQPGTPNATFPGNGATSAFANVTMETFDQTAIRRGCMNCHNQTKVESDFLWVLHTHAFPVEDPNVLLRDPSFRGLKELLEVHREDETRRMSLMMRSNRVAPARRARSRKRNR